MADTVLQPKSTDVKTDTEVQLTGAQLQQMLDAHCQDMKAGMPGFLFYGILSSTVRTILERQVNTILLLLPVSTSRCSKQLCGVALSWVLCVW